MKIISLGRMAVFYIPASKWDTRGYTVKNTKIMYAVHEFLVNNYGGYTLKGPFKGTWRPSKDSDPGIEDVMEVNVAFKGKHRIPKLQKFLARICKAMEEECIYLETGEDSFLIYP